MAGYHIVESTTGIIYPRNFGFKASRQYRERLQRYQVGSVILNSLPAPVVLFTSIVVPCAMVTVRTRLRPGPQPDFERPASHLKYLSNMFFRSCREIPVRFITTDNCMACSCAFMPSKTQLSRSEYLKALFRGWPAFIGAVFHWRHRWPLG